MGNFGGIPEVVDNLPRVTVDLYLLVRRLFQDAVQVTAQWVQQMYTWHEYLDNSLRDES